VTGKGYPDVATRKWVQRIQQTLKIPALGLCDCNPFGVSVLHSYQYGDTPQKHRNLSQMNDDQIEDAIDSDDDDMAQSNVSSSQSISRTSRCKARLQLYWVGLRPSLIEKLDLPRTVFQQLSSIDKKRLDSLLLSDHSFQHQGLDSDQRRQELEDMGKYKVELEALNWLGIDYMSKYIGHLVKSQNVI
jgi:meiotic recombination protein SPO11